MDPWDAVLDLEPQPHRTLEGAELDDGPHGGRRLHRPEVAVHGRPQPSLRAARRRRRRTCSAATDDEITTLRRAALVHEFGTTAIPNSILDKRGPLTRAEFDRVELHPMLTEQMLAPLAGPRRR